MSRQKRPQEVAHSLDPDVRRGGKAEDLEILRGTEQLIGQDRRASSAVAPSCTTAIRAPVMPAGLVCWITFRCDSRDLRPSNTLIDLQATYDLPKRGYVVANNPKRSSTRRLSISLLVKTRTQMFAVNSWHQLDDESRKISAQKLRKIIPKITF